MLRMFVFIILFNSFLSCAVDNEEIIDQAAEENVVNTDDEDFSHNKTFAKIQILNKITAKTNYIDIKVGSEKTWELIKIKVNACWESSPFELSENKISMEIFEKKTEKDAYHQIFSGWMFSSSPSISTIENPIYDVVAIDCHN